MLYHWFFLTLFLVMWVGWLVLWRAMAFNVKAAARSESLASRLSHLAPLVFAGYLLAAPNVPFAALHQRFVPPAIWPAALGAALTFAGAAFSIWARFTIADNWSSDVEVKRDHELIVAGPYAYVRHPIYTGLLLMFAGTALAVGEWRGALAVAIAAAALWRKLKLEEAFMRLNFGEVYDRYAARTPALVPFVI